MKKNKKALSLVIAIGITLVMSVLALYILKYIIPFGKNTKNIEQSSVAYYQADSGIEDALFSNNNNSLDSFKRVDYWINIESEGRILPPTWEWNSEYDSDFNIIRIWKPIQLEIWNNSINPDDLKIYFRVPDLDKNIPETLVWWNLKIINWKISTTNNILNSENSEVTSNQINWDLKSWKYIFRNNWDNEDWRELNDNTTTFKSFYDSNCNTWSWCILKMSVINELKLTSWTSVPYLEWKIETTNNVPLRYTIIKTTWKASDFRKNLKVKVPQQTLNQGLDFTLFQ